MALTTLEQMKAGVARGAAYTAKVATTCGRNDGGAYRVTKRIDGETISVIVK